METELSPDQEKNLPPVPIKTYQWEDLRRAREAGGYPWTHLLKVPLQGEITAADVIRETTPRRSMSREVSRSRTHSPIDRDVQKILILDSSPGSSRKHGEEGEDEGVQIPNFSKEVSLDSEDDVINQAVSAYVADARSDSQITTQLTTPIEIPKNVSPKGILKRRVPEQKYNIGVTETREKTKCCHPLVNKIKHLADKTLHKLEKSDSPILKRKKNNDPQEIRQLKSSPGAVRRQKYSAIKLGDSDEMSKTMSVDTPPSRKKKEHIYEDIEESKHHNIFKSIANDNDNDKNYNESDSIGEKKSNASQDPSLITENMSLKSNEHVMEKLHKPDHVNKEAILLDEEMDPDEPNVDEVFQNQFEERGHNSDSPNITITEITDDDAEGHGEKSTAIPIESSPSPSPLDSVKRNDVENAEIIWSRPNSDHEYEIIEKPPPNIIYTAPSVDEKPMLVKTDDELSSTTSLERKYLQHTSDEEDQVDDKENIQDDNNYGILSAEALQKNIEDRFFVSTPSTPSRTECEVSTSQVDSSALEQLPLKRGSRTKNAEGTESKIQQRIKENTGKLRTQAGKLRTKIQNIKAKQFTMPDKPKINFPDRPKFKMPERPKFSFPDRSKFSLPDRRKFSLPDRPKFKKINISEKLNFGDRKKFSLPERPKFNVPELPKFKMPERPRINFPSFGRKKEDKETGASNSTTDLRNIATVDFETKTYPRLFGRKKKSELPKTSSSPTLNRESTPPPTFTFTRMKKPKNESPTYIPDSPEQPREYGNVDNHEPDFEREIDNQHFERAYDFDKLDPEDMEGEAEPENIEDNHYVSSIPDISPYKQEYTHVINEINNDEFFVRPRGISRENIQVREYLSDEIRQAFKIPKNALALMGSDPAVNDDNLYAIEPEADPELMNEDNEPMRYSSEDLNDKDDGYYTFPPVRPSRAKRKKKDNESIKYIDDSINASMQFSEVDLELPEYQLEEQHFNENTEHVNEYVKQDNQINFTPITDLHSIHEYANDDVIQYPENVPILSQTLPMPPKRKKKFGRKDFRHSSLNDFKNLPVAELWEQPQEHACNDDIIVYRTEHEYIIPQGESAAFEQCPAPPRRNRSRSSRGTSLCDDDRTSHGAESLTLDTHILPSDDIDIGREIRHESPGYATVDKSPCTPSKGVRRSKSKTPPIRRRKSNSSERKYYTVGATKSIGPHRPPRKKSSTSLVTLDSFTKRSESGDLTQYVEIDEPFENVHNKLKSGEIVNKMKDRPLPPPPRPPRGSRRKNKDKDHDQNTNDTDMRVNLSNYYSQDDIKGEDIVEIEASTQTDPLPDDIDFELGLDHDVSMSSSLRDIIDGDSMMSKSPTKSPRVSRPTSRSEKSLKFSDPMISELSKQHMGRTSPTVILVERRVSSPTRINEREEMLTEASLTVQHIDIDDAQIPDVPPLPRSRGISSAAQSSKITLAHSEDRALDRIVDASRDVQLDNLITQRLQVRDLDVGRLNVSELQANKILVSDIEGMTLQVSELDSKSGHISVSGIEFSQSVIDEIVKKFAEISTTSQPIIPLNNVNIENLPRPVSREEETQTSDTQGEIIQISKPSSDPETPKAQEITEVPELKTNQVQDGTTHSHEPLCRHASVDDGSAPPQRPPPPDLSPLLYSYLHDISIPVSYFPSRSFREFQEPHHQTPPPPTRRIKRKPATHQSESSSDDDRTRSPPRSRMPPPVRVHEPTITEAGAQFLRVCHSSISRIMRNMFNSLMSYISGTEDKKDVQMAVVIFLVLIAGLIMFGLSDSRTIHHHHWEFFNPPDGKQ